MPENPTKKPRASKPEQKPIEPRIEQAPDVVNFDQDAEKLLTLMNETVENIKDRDLEIKTSLENRTATLPEDVQSEAAKIATDAKEKIAENEAELLDLKEAADKELENLENAFFAEGEKMGGDGPLKNTSSQEQDPDARPANLKFDDRELTAGGQEKNELEEAVEMVLGPASDFEQTEGKSEDQKQKEVTVCLEGLQAMLANPELPDDEREEIEEQIEGLEESSVAVKADELLTIYAPAATV